MKVLEFSDCRVKNSMKHHTWSQYFSLPRPLPPILSPLPLSPIQCWLQKPTSSKHSFQASTPTLLGAGSGQRFNRAFHYFFSRLWDYILICVKIKVRAQKKLIFLCAKIHMWKCVIKYSLIISSHRNKNELHGFSRQKVTELHSSTATLLETNFNIVLRPP